MCDKNTSHFNYSDFTFSDEKIFEINSHLDNINKNQEGQILISHHLIITEQALPLTDHHYGKYSKIKTKKSKIIN